MATLTLSNHANADHTVDDLTVGQRVKAHPRCGHVHAWGCARDYWIHYFRPKAIGAGEDGSQWKATAVCGAQSASC